MIQQNKSPGSRLVRYWAPEVITAGIFHWQPSSVLHPNREYISLCVCVWGVSFYISASSRPQDNTRLSLWVTGQMSAHLTHTNPAPDTEDSLWNKPPPAVSPLKNHFQTSSFHFKTMKLAVRGRLHHFIRPSRPRFLFNFLPLLHFLTPLRICFSHKSLFYCLSPFPHLSVCLI